MSGESKAQFNLVVLISIIICAGVGAIATIFAVGSPWPGTSVGFLAGLAFGALLTRQARARFALPLLVILLGGIAFILVLALRSNGA